MVSFEIFVKSMLPSLSELKVIPSFCFAFKIPDDVTATNIIYGCRPYPRHGYPRVNQLKSDSSSHIRSVLIGVSYRNCRQTLDVYLLFAILSKLIYIFVTYGLASLEVASL
jgi:hypothetical protein